MKLLLFYFRWCGGMRLYVHVMPVCPVGASVLRGVVLVLYCTVRKATEQGQHH